MTDQLSRREILEKVARGELSAEEGTRLLANPPVIPAPPPDSTAEAQTGPVTGNWVDAEPPDDVPSTWKHGNWWMILFGVATGLTVLVALFAYLALSRAGVGFWFYFWMLLFLLGTVGMILAWQTRSTRWLHVRIRQAPGETPEYINISMPFPIRIATWFFRHFGHYIPQTRDIPMDELIDEVDRSLTPDAPLSIHVDGDDGEKVDLYIG